MMLVAYKFFFKGANYVVLLSTDHFIMISWDIIEFSGCCCVGLCVIYEDKCIQLMYYVPV